MPNYQIGKEVKTLFTKAQKPFKKFNVKDEKGIVIEGVTAWSNLKCFESIVSGASVSNVIVQEGEYNGRKDYTMKDEIFGNMPAGLRQYAKPNMAAVMQKKEESITKSQDRKEDGIKISSTARDATLIVTTFFKADIEAIVDATESSKFSEIMKKWRMARSMLLENWEPKETTSDGGMMPDFSEAQRAPSEPSVQYPSDTEEIPF